jgi:succinoglycan biosynthesis protein ExoO
MPASPLVSIIMPVYNAAGFLTRAVQSAQAQTYKNIEILLIDDCSTDTTVEVAQSLAKTDPRIRVFQQPKNGGPSAARNRGLKEAKGEWITLLDDDDAYHPTRIETLLTHASQQNANIVFDNLDMYDATTSTTHGVALPVSQRPSGAINLATYLTACSPFHKGVKFANLKAFFKKAITTQHGITYSEAYRYGEDLNFYLELFLTGAPAYYTQEAMYIYTMQVSKSGQKSPFTRTIQDSSQLINATQDTLNRWRPKLSQTQIGFVQHRIDQLMQFQTYTQFKQSLKQRKMIQALVLIAKNPFLVKAMQTTLVAKLSPKA